MHKSMLVNCTTSFVALAHLLEVAHKNLAIIQDSIHLGELAGFISPEIECRVCWAIIYDGLGMRDRGLDLVEQAARLAMAKMELLKGHAITVWSQLLLRQEQLAQARTLLQQAQQDVFIQAHRSIAAWYEVETTEAELALRQGVFARALALADHVIPILRQIGMRQKLPRTLYLQGQALLALEQADAARTCWCERMMLLSNLTHLLFAATVLIVLAMT